MTFIYDEKKMLAIDVENQIIVRDDNKFLDAYPTFPYRYESPNLSFGFLANILNVSTKTLQEDPASFSRVQILTASVIRGIPDESSSQINIIKEQVLEGMNALITKGGAIKRNRYKIFFQ